MTKKTSDQTEQDKKSHSEQTGRDRDCDSGLPDDRHQKIVKEGQDIERKVREQFDSIRRGARGRTKRFNI